MSASPVILAQLPQIEAPQIWIEYGRAMSLCRWTRQWMHKQVSDGSVVVRLTDRKLANGRPDRDVLLSSLPDAAQRRYAAEMMHAPAQPSLSLALFRGPHLVKAPRVKAPAAKLAGADRKHAILEPILQMQHAHVRAAAARKFTLADGTPVDSQNRMIAFQIEQAAHRGELLNERTLKRWIAAAKEEGIAGLARKQRNDNGKSRFFTRPENADAACLVAYLHLGDGMSPGLSMQACFDMLKAQRELVGLAERDLPCYETVRGFLGAITPAVKTYAIKGRRKFEEQMLPYLSRAYDEHANAVWVSDHMICDVEVLNDCVPGAKLGEPIRLRLTAIIDYRSRYVVGWSWAWEGSSASIARALRPAILNHGPCKLFYCDNGKDYRKVAAGAIPGYMQPSSAEAEEWVANEMRTVERTGVLGRLGIHVTHCIAHHPQSKHVERFFRTVHLTFCKLWRTYTGGKPSERPEQTDALMAWHRKVLREGRVDKSHHPLASELMRSFEAWVSVYHEKRGRRGRGLNYASCAETFARYRDPEQRPAPTAEQLVPLLAELKTVMVNECQITVNKQQYCAALGDMLTARIMFDLNRKRVTVAYDPMDPSQVAVLGDDGHLLAMLQPKQLVRMAPDDPETQAQIGLMMRQRSTMSRDVRERLTSVIRAGKQLGVQTPLQLLTAAVPTLDPTTDSTAIARITPRKPTFETPQHDGGKLHTNDILRRFRERQGLGGNK